ncbi:MAG: M20/M25/M40 family metallo-hydrolase, partial [Bdellovibrionales bacterium]|nr:M20/M25/M40 family metallo-hydrolase [Bdellovibrionales bacterium]
MKTRALVSLEFVVVSFVISTAFCGLPGSAFAHSFSAHGLLQTKTKPVAVGKKDSGKIDLISDVRQMTFVGLRAGEGYFSPDGRMMVFQSEREEQNPFYQIYLLDRDSGRSVRLSPGDGKTTCAWIHPDRKRVLFSSTHHDPLVKQKTEKEWEERRNPVKGKYSWSFDDEFEIYEVAVGDALKTGKAPEAKSLKRLTEAPGYDAEASYSPDGKKIVFASNRSGYKDPKTGKEADTLTEAEKKIFAQDPSYLMDLYIMNSDGSGVERLTTARGYDGGPFFSADGSKITWRRFAPNGQFAEIMVMDLKTRKEKQLTNMKAMSWAPFFHPSGDYVVFTSNKLGYTNFELFIVDTAGKKEPVRVSFLDGFDGLPVFLPNGQEISWTRRDEKGESQIYIAKWDDGWARSVLGLGREVPKLAGRKDGLGTGLRPEIREQDARAWVSYLASESMKGRRPGSAEEKVYVQEIARTMREMGLEAVVQPFEFTSGVTLGQGNRLRMRERGAASDLTVEKDWMPLSISKSGDVMEAGAVFAGYGIAAPASDKIAAFDSYEGVDPSGKWVVVLRDLPESISTDRRFHYHLYSRPQHKALVAKQKGAVGVILIDHPNAAAGAGLSVLKFEGASEVGIPVVHMAPALVNRLFAGSGKSQAGKSLASMMRALDRGEVQSHALAVSLGGKLDLQFQKASALNVYGRLRGSSRRLGPVILGAHGDHLGLGESGASLARKSEQGHVHYGADDNASGVAALLEVAHSWTSRKRPERDMIFAVWSAEELGVLGSNYFLSQWKGPKIHAYLNMDMVGRLGETLSVQGTGSARQWRGLLESWVERWPVAISSVADPYLPTDAMAFYLKEVPILSFFTGAHGEYHSPRDRYETLNFKGLVEIAKVVDAASVELAKADSRLTWEKVEAGRPQGGEGRSFRLYLGTVPDYTQEGVKGVKISGTSKDSPAEAAGLRAGDVIVALGGIKIESIYDYVYCLQALKADVTVPVQVLRGGRTVELKITPKLKT